jgi:hypothetical protein
MENDDIHNRLNNLETLQWVSTPNFQYRQSPDREKKNFKEVFKKRLQLFLLCLITEKGGGVGANSGGNKQRYIFL